MVEQFPTFRYYYLNQGEGLAGGIQSGVLNDGEVLIGKGNNPAVAANLTAGAGVTIENNPGQVVIHASVVGDVKHGFQNVDHLGWVRLDGRSVGSLTPSQQTAAAGLGFLINLPDATDAYIGSVGGVSLGVTSGSNSVVLGRSNLPDFTLSGVTSTGGSHSHQVRFNYSAPSGGGGRIGAGSSHDSQIPTLSGGNHSHSITTESLNGGVVQQPMSFRPLTVNANVFIFLGL